MSVITPAYAVAPEDERVPLSARRAYAHARREGFWAVLTYAHGHTLNKRGEEGALVENVALRLYNERLNYRGFGVWESKCRARCICGGDYLPTDAGLFRSHKVDGDECAGSGQPAVAVARTDGKREYKFVHAYVASSPGAWNPASATRLDSGEFIEWIKSVKNVQ